MEHLKGSSLDVIMHDPDMRFKEEHVVDLALQLPTGLDELHKLNVFHRDIKPANIVLCPDGPKIIDLGAAAVQDVRDREVNQSLVTQGTVINIAGTHGFMAPEAYRSRHDVGSHSDIFAHMYPPPHMTLMYPPPHMTHFDIFALAVTLYYLVSRRMPFHADNELEWMFAVAGNMEEQAPMLSDVCPDVSAGFSHIIAKGLQKKIPQRYSNAAD
jgi:serine/threonine-protein kinase